MSSQDEQFAIGLLEAFNQRRFDDYVGGFSDDAVVSYPQSGERFHGTDNLRRLFHAFPSPPSFAITNVRSCSDDVVIEADGDYGAGAPWKVVIFYTVRGGRVIAETAYFGAPFPAAEWRAAFAMQPRRPQT
jgi:hypothetical protein